MFNLYFRAIAIIETGELDFISSSSSTEPPRIKLTPESFYSPEGSDSTPPPEKSSVAIDEKAIFLLNGIFSLFYIFPHLEKLLNEPEYSEIKKKPIYAEFLSNASYKKPVKSEASSEPPTNPCPITAMLILFSLSLQQDQIHTLALRDS